MRVPVDYLPQFNPLSRWVYILIAATLAGQTILLAAMGMTIQDDPRSVSSIGAAFMIFSGTMFRRALWPRMGNALEALGVITLLGSSMLVLQYPLAALAIGSPDELLLAADTALGFDWATFARWFQHPLMIEALVQSYRSMIPQCAFAVVLLSAAGRGDRAWMLATAGFIALLLSVLPFPFFAATGQYVGCGLKPDDIAVLPRTCDYGPAIERIRVDGVRDIPVWMRLGLISFPSFHAASAALLVWALWPFRWLRLPFLVVNGLMCIAAIVIAGHYMIDVPAGFAVAAIAILITRRLLRSEHFNPGDRAPGHVGRD